MKLKLIAILLALINIAAIAFCISVTLETPDMNLELSKILGYETTIRLLPTFMLIPMVALALTLDAVFRPTATFGAFVKMHELMVELTVFSVISFLPLVASTFELHRNQRDTREKVEATERILKSDFKVEYHSARGLVLIFAPDKKAETLNVLGANIETFEPGELVTLTITQAKQLEDYIKHSKPAQ